MIKITIKTIISRLLGTGGANVNDADDCRFNPLIIAVSNGDLEMVKILVYAGVDVNAVKFRSQDNYTYTTAMMEAVVAQRSDIVKFLLNNGATVNRSYRIDGVDPVIIVAASNGSTEIVQFLLAANANINATKIHDESTALMHAAKGGHDKIVELLLANNADVHAKGVRGDTAIIYFFMEQKYITPTSARTLKLLINAGADINRRDHKEYFTSGGNYCTSSKCAMDFASNEFRKYLIRNLATAAALILGKKEGPTVQKLPDDLLPGIFGYFSQEAYEYYQVANAGTNPRP